MRFEVLRPLLTALVVAGAFGVSQKAIASPSTTQPGSDVPPAAVQAVFDITAEFDISTAEPEPTNQQFSDVQPSDWAYEALAYLANSEAEGGLDCCRSRVRLLPKATPTARFGAAAL